MSEQSQGHGWWYADDGLWYPPEQHPDPNYRATLADSGESIGAIDPRLEHLPPPPSDYSQHPHGRPVGVWHGSDHDLDETHDSHGLHVPGVPIIPTTAVQRLQLKTLLLTLLVVALVLLAAAALYWLISRNTESSTSTATDVGAESGEQIAPNSTGVQDAGDAGGRELEPLDRTVPVFAGALTEDERMTQLHQIRAVLLSGPPTVCELQQIQRYLIDYDEFTNTSLPSRSEFVVLIDVTALHYRQFADVIDDPDAQELAIEYAELMESPDMETLVLVIYEPQQVAATALEFAEIMEEMDELVERGESLEGELRNHPELVERAAAEC